MDKKKEPRFEGALEDGPIRDGVAYFVCLNLDDIEPEVSQSGRRRRDELFGGVLAWCTDQFGPPMVNFKQCDSNLLPGQWRHTSRIIVLNGVANATAFKMRWC